MRLVAVVPHTDADKSYSVGDEYDVDDALGETILANGMAARVPETGPAAAAPPRASAPVTPMTTEDLPPARPVPHAKRK
jgi:hypothetical protein